MELEIFKPWRSYHGSISVEHLQSLFRGSAS
uniref:Uncharacterized protein n=1 Tax=Arundo donax TaxID=35708 RepID=A0A0A8Z1B2_ARUDO